MKKPSLVPPPPRISEFIVLLFVAADVSESVIGDLQEEFLSLSAKLGTRAARAWYRRQAIGTILHSVFEAFRRAALPILLGTLAGAWFIRFGTQWSGQRMRILLDARRVYEINPSAYLFWLKFPFEFGRVVLCVMAGATLAFVCKRREMPAALTLAFFQIALFSFSAVFVVMHERVWLDWFATMARWNIADAFGMIVGAAAVRWFRQSAAVRPSNA